MPLNSSRSLGSLLIASTLATATWAQEVPEPSTNNPFSRLGVGELAPHAYAAQVAMGGIGQAFTDAHIASPTNPASLGALRYTSFQVGLGLDRSRLESGGIQNTNVDGNLDYLSLAFPLQNSLQRVLDGKQSKWRNGMLLALAPYSNVGYDIELVSEVEGLGSVQNRFQGSGGYYRLQWGNGVAYDSKFRAGVNLSYIFGRTNTLQAALPQDVDVSARVLSDNDAFRGRGVELQAGAQYDIALPQSARGLARAVTVGATYRLGTRIEGEASRLATLYPRFNPLATDTVSFATEVDQSVELPATLGFGAYYRTEGRFGFGFDVTRTSWSQYRNTIRPNERLDDVTSVSVGAEFIPDAKAFGQYWQLVRYRAGAYLRGDPRAGIDDEQGVSFGVGLPVIRPREEVSYVNLAVNTGRFGDAEGISQRYIRLTVGFTLTDNSWFYKRRFN